MITKNLKFKNKEGIELSAKLELPIDQQPKAYAVFAHCFTCNKNFHGPRNISRNLTARGFAVLLFDFTGLGQSGGDFESTNFSTNISDVIDAVNFLSENYETPKIIIGHSLGGLAALYTANQLKEIEAVVTIGSPFMPSHLKKLLSKGLEEIKKEGKAEVNIGGRPFMIDSSFIEDIEKHDTRSVAKELRRALLIMHSPQDEIVSIDNAAQLYNSAMHPKSFISLDGASHLLQNQADSSYVGQVISTWVTRYIEVHQESTPTKVGEVIAQTNHESYLTEIRANEHRFIMDEPEEVGGSNLGPTPHQMLSAALAACSTMTMQMYAKRKDWPLESATASVIHAKVDKEVEGKTVKVDQFKRLVEIKGDLNEEQRNRIFEISNKCPVKRTLESDIEIISTLKE